MSSSMFLAGPHNKSLRTEIMLLLTGQKHPATKCGIHNVSDTMKASFEQISLF